MHYGPIKPIAGSFCSALRIRAWLLFRLFLESRHCFIVGDDRRIFNRILRRANTLMVERLICTSTEDAGNPTRVNLLLLMPQKVCDVTKPCRDTVE
jgi:hypothetical protein